MKTLLAFAAVLLAATLCAGQTNVDRLARTLDSLGTVSFDSWKVSPDLKSLRSVGDAPARAGFDDSQWSTLRLDQSVYPDSCWIRREIVLPEQILGVPVAGPVRLLLSVDDYGYLWVNGESRGMFPWDGDFELTPNAVPGQKFLIAIKAINTGGPLRLIRAELGSEASRPLRDKISGLALSLRVGQKLLSFDTYQTNARRKQDPGTDQSRRNPDEKKRLNDLLQSLAARVDAAALARGDVARFEQTVEEVRPLLKPVADYAKTFTLFFDANAHIDAAWLWRKAETKEVVKNTFASVLNMMRARPDFTYTQSAAAYYQWVESSYPELFKGIKERVADGRWEVVGGMWVEPDCNLPSGESWMRQLLYAKRYLRSTLGADVKIGWNPDSFGYNANMPMFYANAGITAFITQKIGWNDTNVFPYRLFWWESPDGSRVLSYFPFDYVNTVDDPYRLVDWSRQFEANTGMTKMMILFGVGDHGGGPSLDMIDRIERLKTLDIYPAIEYGTTASYLSWIAKQDLSQVPVWKDELYLEYHQGTYTTQAAMKKHNRESEVLLTNAEKFSSIATLYGKPYGGAALESAWRSVLFNQFHDLLPGSGIREIYLDAAEDYAAAMSSGSFELDASLDRIAGAVKPAAGKGTPLVVFNALGWERTDVVTLDLPEQDGAARYTIADERGAAVPSQIVRTDARHAKLLFIAAGVPALGYKVYDLRSGGTAEPAPAPAAGTAIENELFRVAVDPATGWVGSIVDKRGHGEILAGPGNELQLLEDKPAAWDAWNVGLTGVKYPTTLRGVEVVENGPVRSVVRVTRDYLKPGTKKDFPTEDFPSTFITQDVALYRGLDRVDFTTNIDWWEEKTMAKVAFPLAVSDTAATYEIPYGSVRRSTQWRNSWDSAKVEVPAQRWADLSQDGYGVSLLNRSKYGYDIKGNVMRLSLLRSPKWPDPTADRGKHAIEYALFPHAGRVDSALTVRRGYEYNNPLIPVTASRAGKKTLPAAHSFASLEPSSLVLTTVKKAEDGDAWIFQWYNAGGGDADGVLALPKAPASAALSNALEETGAPVAVSGTTVHVPTRPHALVTLKVKF
jgi:alpha-mannosidase